MELTASPWPDSLRGHSQSRWFRVISDLAFTPTDIASLQDLSKEPVYIYTTATELLALGTKSQVVAAEIWPLVLGKLKNESVVRSQQALPVISVLLVFCSGADSLH